MISDLKLPNLKKDIHFKVNTICLSKNPLDPGSKNVPESEGAVYKGAGVNCVQTVGLRRKFICSS